MNWLKKLIARNNATTPCAVLPGDVVRVTVAANINRACDYHGKILGVVASEIHDVYEWEVTRPYRTIEDAVLAAHQTLSAQYVQMKDYI